MNLFSFGLEEASRMIADSVTCSGGRIHLEVEPEYGRLESDQAIELYLGSSQTHLPLVDRVGTYSFLSFLQIWVCVSFEKK